MTVVADIEDAVSRLSPTGLVRFRSWFEAFEAERADRRIEEDVAAGKLDGLADEGLADLRRGDVREL